MVKLELATLFARTEMNELGEQAISLGTSSELSNNSSSSCAFQNYHELNTHNIYENFST